MSAIFHHGEPVMIDHTPGSAVTAGDMVAVGAHLCVAHKDIAADELGALLIPGGQSVYKITLLASDAFSAGDAVTVTPGTGLTNGVIGTAFGWAVADADEAAGDTVVIAVLDN